MIESARDAGNLFELEQAARDRLDADVFDYLAGGSDDMRTVRRNRAAFERVAIRARRLVDVSRIDTSVQILGESWPAPWALAPVGYQRIFHPEGELETARGAAANDIRMIVSTVSSAKIEDVTAVAPGSWFQLYPTPDRERTARLVAAAEAAGCPVVVLTVDVPVLGNREQGGIKLADMVAAGSMTMGNFPDADGPLTVHDPSLDWSFIGWLRERSRTRIVLKGIVTAEDAGLALRHGVDGLIVSNHGGRQEESDRSTIESLPEVAAAVDGRLPILIDGGFRRGTDVFKALALGASAVSIGRPYCWGLAASGHEGVARALEILHGELERIMQFAGTTSVSEIGRGCVETRHGRE